VWGIGNLDITAASFVVLTTLVVFDLLGAKRRYLGFVPGLLIIDVGAALVLWYRYIIGVTPPGYVKGVAVLLGVVGVVLVEYEFRKRKRATRNDPWDK